MKTLLLSSGRRSAFFAPSTGSSSALRNPGGQQHGSAGGRDESTRERSLPLRGGWHPASHASRMTEEVIFVPLLHSSKRAAIRYDTSSVACGDTFPSRGRTWGWNSSRFCVRRSGLRVKIPPLEGRVASGVSRKPDDGRGDLRSAFASVGTDCDSVRHLFRRLRRHLPLKGKDLGPNGWSPGAIFNLFSMKPLLFCREADIIYWW